MTRHRSKPTTLPALAAALVDARERLGKSQAAMAEGLAVSQVAVSGWERGCFPRADRLAKIARAYALPVDRVRALWMAGTIKAAA